MDSDSTRNLRFGIMCTGTTFSAWEARCISTLIALGNVSPKLLIIDQETSDRPEKIPTFSLTYRRALMSTASMKPVDLLEELTTVPAIRCSANFNGECSGYFKEDDLVEIRSYNLDFILNFGFNRLRGQILEVARYGNWSFRHNDETKYKGGPPCFWEIYYGDPVISASLQKVTEHLDAGIILKRGVFPTEDYSYTASLDRVLFDSAEWAAHVCIDILNGNDCYFDTSPPKTTAPIFRSPTKLQKMLFRIKLAKNLVIKVSQLLFRHDEWNVGIVDRPIDSFLNEGGPPSIHWLPKLHRSQYIADPFGFTDSDKITLLCECFDYTDGRGSISSIELSDTGYLISSKPAICKPFHLSYPYLLKYQGETYCIPETSELREVALYKAERFPTNWVKVTTLIEDFPGLDSTVFQYEGRWWLTCTNAEQGRNHKLFIWYSNSLFGPWQPHALTPAKTDIRSSRPGGTPFIHHGFLYRPAQDCSETYGGRVVINRVTHLTPTTFEEEPHRTIAPAADGLYRDGLHTLSKLGETRTLVDGKRHSFYLGGLMSGMGIIRKRLRAGLE